MPTAVVSAGRFGRALPPADTPSLRSATSPAMAFPSATWERVSEIPLPEDPPDCSLRAMSASAANPAVENVLNAVEACLDATSAEALARLRAPAELQARIEALAERCTEGQLTEDEREEYETLVRLGNFVGILQARARRRIGPGQAA